MSQPDERPPSDTIPPWAMRQAADELYDTLDAAAVASRAREIANESRQLEDERHDEFDDPDLGGEA